MCVQAPRRGARGTATGSVWPGVGARRCAVEALRFVVCDRRECRQVFFLCSPCDTGQRYCGQECSRRARRHSVREAGRRYQSSRDGRRAHAARQQAYRERRRKIVTHQSPVAGVSEATLAIAPEPPATEAKPQPVSTGAVPYVPLSMPTCALCGRQSPFTRHTTVAGFRPAHRRRRL